jgi:hypothetical protein
MTLTMVILLLAVLLMTLGIALVIRGLRGGVERLPMCLWGLALAAAAAVLFGVAIGSVH